MKNEEITQKIIEHSVLIKEVREDVKEIKNNHLPHLDGKIQEVKKRIDWTLGLIITGIMFPLFFIAIKEYLLK